MQQRRFYYLSDNLDSTVKFTHGCENRGIPYDNIHVLAKNDKGLVRHHVHLGSPLQIYDVIHLGEKGAIWGAVIGFILAMAIWIWNPFEPDIKFWMVIPVWVLCTLHGAWSGGLIGTHSRNYRIKPFLKDIEQGKHLILVDIDQDQVSILRELERSIGLKAEGHTPTGNKIFENPFSFELSHSEWPKMKR